MFKKIKFINACLNIAKEIEAISKNNKEVFKEIGEIVSRIKNISPKLASLLNDVLGLLK